MVVVSEGEGVQILENGTRLAYFSCFSGPIS